MATETKNFEWITAREIKVGDVLTSLSCDFLITKVTETFPDSFSFEAVPTNQAFERTWGNLGNAVYKRVI